MITGNLAASGAVAMTARNTGTTRSEAKAAARGAQDNGSDADETTASGRGTGDSTASGAARPTADRPPPLLG
jgi:hypothetical protein